MRVCVTAHICCSEAGGLQVCQLLTTCVLGNCFVLQLGRPLMMIRNVVMLLIVHVRKAATSQALRHVCKISQASDPPCCSDQMLRLHLHVENMHSVFRGTGAALLHTSGSGISPAPHAVHRHGLRNPAAAATAKKPANSVRGFGSTLAKPRKPKKKPKKDPNKLRAESVEQPLSSECCTASAAELSSSHCDRREQWDFEQLMLYWDDVFKASCEVSNSRSSRRCSKHTRISR